MKITSILKFSIFGVFLLCVIIEADSKESSSKEVIAEPINSEKGCSTNTKGEDTTKGSKENSKGEGKPTKEENSNLKGSKESNNNKPSKEENPNGSKGESKECVEVKSSEQKGNNSKADNHSKGSNEGNANGNDKNVDCRDILCPAIWDPVCGFNGKCYRTFSSKCVLKHANCGLDKKDQYKQVKKDVCNDKKKLCSDEFNLICPDEINPVCAFNDICFETFNNICELHNRNCGNKENVFQLRGYVKCKEFAGFRKLCGNDTGCPDNCDEDAEHILCGFNGKKYKTFLKPCLMGKANCEEDLCYKVMSKEKCPKDK